MTNDDVESLQGLSVQVAVLQRDFYKHSEDVNKSLKQIFDFISQEIGARRERETNISMMHQRSELTWTKLMAISGIIGACQITPAIIHAFSH